jgi:hypothetical protein
MVAKIWKQLIQQAMLQKQLKIIVDGFAEKIA